MAFFIDEYIKKGEEGLPVRLPDQPLEPLEADEQYFHSVITAYLGKLPNYEEELPRRMSYWMTKKQFRPENVLVSDSSLVSNLGVQQEEVPEENSDVLIQVSTAMASASLQIDLPTQQVQSLGGSGTPGHWKWQVVSLPMMSWSPEKRSP